MNKKYVLFFTFIFMTFSTINAISDTHTTPQTSNNSKRKNSISVISAIGSTSTLLYYLMNIKFIGGSAFFIVFTLLRHIFQSKVSQSDHDQTKERVSLLEKEINILRELLKNEITKMTTGLSDQSEMLSQIDNSTNLQTKEINEIKGEVYEVKIISQDSKIQIISLKENINLIKNLIDSEDQKIELQGTKMEKLDTKLVNLSNDVGSLKEFDEKHDQTLTGFANTMTNNSKNTEVLNEKVENINEKIDKINESNKTITHDMGEIKNSSGLIATKLEYIVQNLTLQRKETN